MTDKHELAYVDYQNGMKYKDIAEKYDVSLGTVNSWKSRYKWVKGNKKPMHKNNKSLCIENIKPIHKNIKIDYAEIDNKEDVNHVLENDDLNDKQKLFCIYYIKSFNATKAYQRVYDCSYETAMTNGCSLLSKAKVKAEIMRLKQGKMNKAMLEPSDIFQRYMDIAYSDMADYLADKEGEITLKRINQVDGTLIREISKSKDGSMKIKLLDSQKALDWISSHMDMATEEQKIRIESMKMRAGIGGEGNAKRLQELKNIFEDVADGD